MAYESSYDNIDFKIKKYTPFPRLSLFGTTYLCMDLMIQRLGLEIYYIVYCVIWYIAYMFFEYAIIRSCFSNSSKKVKGMGRSYLASTLNALLCSICGIYIFMKMKDESVLCKYFFISCDDTRLLNFTLISGAQLSAHFSNDLIGLFFTYPRDPRETNAAIAIHHLIFLSCGIIGSVFYLSLGCYKFSFYHFNSF